MEIQSRPRDFFHVSHVKRAVIAALAQDTPSLIHAPTTNVETHMNSTAQPREAGLWHDCIYLKEKVQKL